MNEACHAEESRIQRIRQVMLEHVQSRLDQATEKYHDRSDAAARKKIQDAQEKYQIQRVLEKGLQAALSIAIASHIAKPIHPDLRVKEVSNLALDLSSLPALAELGSHALNADLHAFDATGNGSYNSAAYELYLLLDCQFEGATLGQWLMDGDRDAVQAFAGNAPDADKQVGQWLELLRDKCPQSSVHTLSKQMYWLIQDDALKNEGFEILVPLFPAWLVHRTFLHIQEHRFGEANKAARQARRDGKAHEGVFHDYPDLAVQKMGGTKPQNISQLNSERGGVNYLLASLPPPTWKASPLRLPVNVTSVFERLFGDRPLVRQTVRELRTFLESDPDPTMDTRLRREAMVDTLIDELVSMAGELQQGLPAGWTRDRERYGELVREEALWLDPLRVELPDEDAFAEEWLWLDWPDDVGRRFGNWLNAQLKDKLPVGDVEFREWKKELLTDGGFATQLAQRRKRLHASQAEDDVGGAV